MVDDDEHSASRVLAARVVSGELGRRRVLRRLDGAADALRRRDDLALAHELAELALALGVRMVVLK